MPEHPPLVDLEVEVAEVGKVAVGKDGARGILVRQLALGEAVVDAREDLHERHLRQDAAVDGVGEGRLQKQLVLADLQRLGDHRRPPVRDAEVVVAYVQHVPEPCPEKVLPVSLQGLAKRLVEVELRANADRVSRELPRY